MNKKTGRPKELVRRSELEWQAIFHRHQQSGLSQKAFCQQESIGFSTFQKWRKALSNKAAARNDFIEVTAPVLSALWDIELDLGAGICLRLRKG